MPKDLSRLILKLKIHALGLGHPGVSRETFDRLLLFAERALIPAVPGRGVELAHETVPETIPHREEGYLFADDLDESLAFARDDALLGSLTDELGALGRARVAYSALRGAER